MPLARSHSKPDATSHEQPRVRGSNKHSIAASSGAGQEHGWIKEEETATRADRQHHHQRRQLLRVDDELLTEEDEEDLLPLDVAPLTLRRSNTDIVVYSPRHGHGGNSPRDDVLDFEVWTKDEKEILALRPTDFAVIGKIGGENAGVGGAYHVQDSHGRRWVFKPADEEGYTKLEEHETAIIADDGDSRSRKNSLSDGTHNASAPAVEGAPGRVIMYEGRVPLKQGVRYGEQVQKEVGAARRVCRVARGDVLFVLALHYSNWLLFVLGGCLPPGPRQLRGRAAHLHAGGAVGPKAKRRGPRPGIEGWLAYLMKFGCVPRLGQPSPTVSSLVRRTVLTNVASFFKAGTLTTLDADATIGSLQEFAEHVNNAEEMGSSAFPVEDVHRIGVLDIRLLNLDRHLGNILVANAPDGSGSKYHLVPIDHGYCLPDFRNISDTNFEWMYFRQAKQPFSQQTLQYIRALDPQRDVLLLKQLGIRDESVLSNVIATLLLKQSAERGLSLYHIADMVQRSGFREKKSVLENIIDRALVLCPIEDGSGAGVYSTQKPTEAGASPSSASANSFGSFSALSRSSTGGSSSGSDSSGGFASFGDMQYATSISNNSSSSNISMTTFSSSASSMVTRPPAAPAPQGSKDTGRFRGTSPLAMAQDAPSAPVAVSRGGTAEHSDSSTPRKQRARVIRVEKGVAQGPTLEVSDDDDLEEEKAWALLDEESDRKDKQRLQRLRNDSEKRVRSDSEKRAREGERRVRNESTNSAVSDATDTSAEITIDTADVRLKSGANTPRAHTTFLPSPLSSTQAQSPAHSPFDGPHSSRNSSKKGGRRSFSFSGPPSSSSTQLVQAGPQPQSQPLWVHRFLRVVLELISAHLDTAFPDAKKPQASGLDKVFAKNPQATSLD